MWAILGAQAQTHSGILGAGTTFHAQKQFMANVEDAISSPVDLPLAIRCYQDVLQYARSEVNFSFGTGLYMAPSNMLLRVGNVVGYNNLIIVATDAQSLGLNSGLNMADVSNTPPDAANDTGERGLVQPPTRPPPHSNTGGVSMSAEGTSRPVSDGSSSSGIALAKDHDDKKTALIVGGVATGLLVLWLLR